MHSGYIWDDDVYVYENRLLLSPGGLAQIWTEPTRSPQYYPLVFTAFWLEDRLWGLQASGYHAVNILLHAGTAILFWRVMRQLQIPGAWLAALLFAIHPVQVESVAWITERKNVLSGLFYFAALSSYCRYHEAYGHGSATRQTWVEYGLSLVWLLAALLSKTVTSSLPVVILLILWWKNGRVSWRDVIPLLPMFVMGLALGLVTVQMERQHVGAIGSEWELSVVERSLVAGRALWFYALKLAAPVNLIFIYPRWQIDAGVWWQYLYPAAFVALVIGLFLGRRRIGRGPLTAVLAFAVTVFPALGFFNVYPHRYSFVADHFQYLACAPLLLLFAAILMQLALKRSDRSYGPAAIGCLVVLTLALLSREQTEMYRDAEKLYRVTMERNPNAGIAYTNLGVILLNRGDVTAARDLFQKRLELPVPQLDRDATLSNIGLTYAKEGNWRSPPSTTASHSRCGLGWLKPTAIWAWPN